MVFSEFFDYINKLKGSLPRPEDLSDRLNFVWTPVLLLLCSIVVFGKQYVLKSIACFFSDIPTPLQASFLVYAENYCWITGTYAYSRGTENCKNGDPDKCDIFWESRIDQKLNYYQWVPFVLGLQGVITYIPKLFWQLVCSRHFGTDIYSLVEVAAKAKTGNRNTFDSTSAGVADVVERMLLHNRDYRSGTLQRLKDSLYYRCGPLLCFRREGKLLSLLYIVVKAMCIAIAIGQLRGMEYFLDYNGQPFTFGWALLRQVANRTQWPENEFFPLMTMCRVPTFELGSKHAYKGQCTLPVNILNEKIYTFLYFWFLLVACVSVLFTAKWLYRILCPCSSVHFVKLCLRSGNAPDDMDKKQVRKFITKFLRHDGLFLLMMLCEGADKVITTEVVRLLFLRYRELEQKKEQEAERQQQQQLLPPVLEVKTGLKKKGASPTAPNDSGYCV